MAQQTMKKWEVMSKVESPKSKVEIDEVIDIILANRGVGAKKDREAFLTPDLSSVTLESVGIDKKQSRKAIERIKNALANKEQIVVYGDYDVDGITSSAIIWETLHAAGGAIMPYIPSRMDEGYGLSVKGISNVKLQISNVKLIITVDNGIVANEAVQFANEQGIDVIITDHHVIDDAENLPSALAIVHTTSLCGAGIAYFFSKELRKSLKLEEKEDTYLELAALGTVADLVPLQGANRAIVKYGIQALCRTTRPGLLALYQEAACDASTLGVYQIGHIIAPRLNATGRIEHAMDSLRLLCTTDKKRALELAMKLGTTNRERQNIMRTATDHAINRIKNYESRIKNLLIIDDENYQEGVIGLVAGRLVEEFYRPSIVISRGEKVSKGSVRSVTGFNIIEFLREHGADHFINVGGHPMAAGFTIETDKIVMLRNVLEVKADELIEEEMLLRKLKIDCLLPFDIISPDLYRLLQKLAPFGMGNPEPVFETDGVIVKDFKVIGKEGQHLRLFIEKDGKTFEAIAFAMGELAHNLKEGDVISLAYSIDENAWNGQTKLQLKVKDIRLSN